MNLKKTTIFAMALAFCSCVQEAEDQFPKGTNSFLAESAEELKTKITLDEDGTPLWEAGDKVSVWGGQFDNALYTADYAGDRTSLSTEVEGEIADEEVYCAMSPYVEGATYADGKFVLTLPAEQKVPATRLTLSPAVATTTGAAKTFGFRNVCGLMSFVISQEGVAKAMIYSNGQEKIAGTLTIDCADFTNPVATLEGTSSVITLTPAEGETFETGVYYLALPPMTLEMGVSISLFKADGTLVSKHKSSAFEIKRSNLYQSGEVDAAGFSSNYVIKTAQQLQGFLSIAEHLPATTTASLANDIDLAGIELHGAKDWYGTFDGKGYSLKNWNCAKALVTNNYGTIKNIKIDESCSISLKGVNSVAFIATTNARTGIISGCENHASLNETLSDDKSKLFGFITVNNYGTVSSCFNYGDFTYVNNSTKGNVAIGMIAAQQRLAEDKTGNPSMEGCVNNGSLKYTAKSYAASINVGGILGRSYMNVPDSMEKQGTMSQCTNNGDITLTYIEGGAAPVTLLNLGGVVGYYEGEMTECVNGEDAVITLTTPIQDDACTITRPAVGGVAGTIAFGASNCVNNAAINVTVTSQNASSAAEGMGCTKATSIAGVFGVAGPNTKSYEYLVQDCYNNGTLTFVTSMSCDMNDTHCFGGVIGYSTLGLKICKNTAPVNVRSKASKSYVGGVVALNPFHLLNCDNSGNISFDYVNTQENGNQGNGGLSLGGILGYLSAATTESTKGCDNTAKLMSINGGYSGVGTSNIGGVLGTYSGNGTTFNNVTCSATIECSIPSKVMLGGITVKCHTGMTAVKSTGDITVEGCSSESVIGGIMGDMVINGKTFNGCSYVGNINVTTSPDAIVYTGMVAGQNSNEKSFWSFNLNGDNTNVLGGSITSTDKTNTGFIMGKAVDKAKAQTLTLKNAVIKAGTSVNGTVVTAENCDLLAIGNKGTNVAVVKDDSLIFE